MKADVVVNFINFYTSVEEEQEDDEEILRELRDAGLKPEEIDAWVEGLVRFEEYSKKREVRSEK